MIHWQFHCNEIHTIWYLLLNMFSIAVILMKHIYMYNTTFCLNSQSLAFFFSTFFFVTFTQLIHTGWLCCSPPKNTCLLLWNVLSRVVVCVVSCVERARLCVCLHNACRRMGSSLVVGVPFCDAGQLTLRHNLWAGDAFLLCLWDPKTCHFLFLTQSFNTSACWNTEKKKKKRTQDHWAAENIFIPLIGLEI